MPGRIQYCFSQNNKENEPQQNQDQAQANKNLSYVDELKQKTKNQLIQIKMQQIAESQKTKKEYRDAVLFEEILNTQKVIPLYDCFGKVFRHELIKNFIFVLSGFGILYYFYNDPDSKPKKKTFLCALTLSFIATRVLTYRRLQKSFVDKIVYDTTTQMITLTKRTFYGKRFDQELNPALLLFTNDKALNMRNINYINMETLETYQIGYDYAWKNKALFSHILEQRIETIRNKKK
ncbi:hypothetical protein ABPG74_012098 [Tetrahymena malaccensis]